jgi:hypothetical protein
MRGSRTHSSVSTARVIAALVVSIGGAHCASVCAQVQRSGGGANAQVLQQLQQAVSERAQLQAENAKLKKDGEDLKKQLDAAQSQLTALKAGAGRNQAAVAAARAAGDTTQKSLDETKAKMQELVGRFRETITNLRTVETERTQLKQQLATSQAAFDQCAQDNYGLYEINSEVLDRYANQSAWSYVKRSEPFTKLKRTQIDNLVVEYRQRAEELRMKKSATTGGPATQAAPGPGAPPTPKPAPAPAPTPKATVAPAPQAPSAPATPNPVAPAAPSTAATPNKQP